MKTVITILGLLIATVNVSEAQNLEGKLATQDDKITNLGISVTVDSAEEVKATFNMKDIKNILNEVGNNEDVSFEIVCKDQSLTENSTKKVSYRVTGNSNDKNSFLKRIKKIRKAAIKFYTNND